MVFHHHKMLCMIYQNILIFRAGHYTVDLVTPSNHLFRCDDFTITQEKSFSEEGYLFIYELIVPENQPCSEIQLEVLKLDALENVSRHVPDEHNQESDSDQNTGLLHNEMESENQQTSQQYEPKLCHVCKECQMHEAKNRIFMFYQT